MKLLLVFEIEVTSSSFRLGHIYQLCVEMTDAMKMFTASIGTLRLVRIKKIAPKGEVA